MKFHYKAQAKIGVVIEDIIEAKHEQEVIDLIRKQGATPIIVEKVAQKTLSIPILDRLFQSVSLQDKIVFAKNLARMLQAGLSVSRSLEVLVRQTHKVLLQSIFRDIADEINTGGSLSSGLAKHADVFSPMFIAMVRAGEESGKIAENLLAINIQLEKTYTLRKKIKGAMMYPGVIVSAMMVIGILMFMFVVPTLLNTFKDFNLDLPTSTKIIIFVSDSLQEHTVLFLGGLVAIVAGVIAMFRAPIIKPYLDYVSVRIPVVGEMIKEVHTAVVARTLGSLLGSGISVHHALEITQDVVQNVHYKKTLQDGIGYISAGGQISQLFKEQKELYPVMVGEMVEVGEETGHVVEMLEDVATYFEDEVDAKTKNLSTIIEPLLMLVIGGAVAFFAVAMMTPMYSLVGGMV
jgi:type IV pilus assembly protein PilC